MPFKPPFIDQKAKGLGCGPLSSHRCSWAAFLHHLLSCNVAEAGLDAEAQPLGWNSLADQWGCPIATVYVTVWSFLCDKEP